jgi:hypothetical protein
MRLVVDDCLSPECQVKRLDLGGHEFARPIELRRKVFRNPKIGHVTSFLKTSLRSSTQGLTPYIV